MTSIGYATLQIIPSMRGVQSTIQREMNGVMPAAGTAAGAQMGGAFTRAASSAIQTLATTTATMMTAAGGTAIAALSKGWSRFTTIENSVGALEISLGSAEAAGGLLADTLEVVRGTPFNLDQFASAAQQMAGMGLEADKIPGYLEAIGEAAATQGGRAGEMAGRLSTVFGQMAASGQVQLADVWRISDTGVNALGILANHFGLTTDQMKDMISEGAVPAGEALDALAKGILDGSDGPAGATLALAGTMDKLRQTTTGAVGGISPALARLGAAFVGAFSPSIITSANGLTDSIDRLTDKAPEWAERMADSTAVQFVVDLFEDLPDLIDRVPGSLGDIAPMASAALAGLTAMGSGSLPVINKFLPAINPVAAGLAALIAASPEARDALGDVFAEVAPLAMELSEELLPVIEDLSEIAGSVLPPALQLTGAGLSLALEVAIPLAQAVAGLTGFLADHEVVVLAAAAAWALFKVQAAGAALFGSLAAGASAIQASTASLVGMRAAIQGIAATRGVSELAASMGVLRASMTASVSSGAAFGGMLAGVTAGAMAASYALDKLHESGKRDASGWLEGLGDADLSTIDSSMSRLVDINDRIQTLNQEMNSGSTNRFDDEKLAAEILALEDAFNDLQPGVLSSIQSLGDWSKENEMAVETVEALGVAAGIDLVDMFDKSGQPTKEFGEALLRARDSAELLNVDLTSMESPEALAAMSEQAEELQTAMAKAAEAAGGAVRSFGDVLSLADGPLSGEKIATFYEDQITAVREFQANITTAIEAGFDPALIGRIIQAGPGEAAPILEQLVANATGSFVEMVNAAEAELGELATQSAEMARLTEMAVSNHSESGQQMVRDLAAAQAISLGHLKRDGTETIEELAKIAGLSVAEYERVAGAFNLSLDDILTKAQRLQGFFHNIETGITYTGRGVPIQPRASGGPFDAGWVLAGEEGPELMHIGSSGYVLDAKQTAKILSSQHASSAMAAAQPASGKRRRGGSIGDVTLVGPDAQTVVSGLMWEMGR